MRSLLQLLLVVCLLIAFTPAQAQEILGKWSAPDIENSTIQIYTAQDGYLYGRIVDCDREDWIGKIVIKKIKYDSTQEYWKGTIYSLRTGMTINATLSLENENRLKLVGTKFFMTRTFYWTR